MRTTLPEALRARADAAAEQAASLALERAGPYDFGTYACGSRLPKDLENASKEVRDGFREAVRARLRTRLAEAWPGRRLDHERPEVTVEAIPDHRDVALRVTPILVAGRYRKLVRGLSQTVFHCRTCRGGRRRHACDDCEGSGRLVAESVEDHVRPAIERAFDGRRSAFHGSGREDVDVLMLGDGRPFVVSVEKPRRRAFDAAEVESLVEERSGGRVTVAGLRLVDRAEMKRITADHGEKTYRVVLDADAALPDDAAARLATLSGATLEQRTPRRVEERRADRVRERRIIELVVEAVALTRATFIVRTDPGTYVKEFVSGDDGRTEPSCASVLGVACVCAELDVLGVG